jgi:hypothetical protein
LIQTSSNAHATGRGRSDAPSSGFIGRFRVVREDKPRRILHARERFRMNSRRHGA